MTTSEPAPSTLTTKSAVKLYDLMRRDFEAATAHLPEPLGEAEALTRDVVRHLLVAMTARRFGAEPPLDEITAFLATPRVLFHPRPMPMIDAEAVLRDALGEPEIKRGMKNDAELNASLYLLVYLADDLKLPATELVDAIARAERAALAPYAIDTP